MAMCIGDRLRDARGITLTELAVALGIFGMIMLGVVGTWSKTQEAYFVGSEAAEVQQNVRAAIDFMVRELRAAGRDVTNCAFDYAGSPTLDCSSDKVTGCRNLPTATPPGIGLISGGYTANGCQNIFSIPFNGSLSVGGGITVSVPTASAINVRADRNDNGMIRGTANSSGTDGADENVTYFLATSTPPCPSGVPACIARFDGASGTSSMVSVDIQGFTLTYFPRRGYPPCNPPVDPCPAFNPAGGGVTSQTDADNIGRIRIMVQAVQTTAGQTVIKTLTTDVIMSNRN
jgi:Tfp pilus assembly protein PilW